MYNLTGQVRLITGGAQGIGFGIARELARVGSCVVIADRDLTIANAMADELRGMGHEAIALQLDVTDSESVNR